MINLSNLLICPRTHILCDARRLMWWFSLCPVWTAFSGLDSPQVEHISSLSLLQYRAHVAYCAQMLSRVRLCDPMDCSPPESSVHGILQARTLEWVAMPSSRRSSQPRDQTRVSWVSCIGWWVLYHWHHLGSPTYCLNSKIGLWFSKIFFGED